MCKKKRQKCAKIQQDYIRAYIDCLGIKKKAAKKVGVHEQTVMNWFREDYFIEAVEEAKKQWTEMLEATALKRAVESSDTMLIFMLKACNPEKYDDRYRAQKLANEALIESAQILRDPVFCIAGETKKEELALLTNNVEIEDAEIVDRDNNA